MANPVAQAAMLGHEAEVKKYLASNDVNAEIENGQTLLHIACTENQFGVAKLLIKKGANPNIDDNQGWTAFHSAASSKGFKILEYMIKNTKHPNLNAQTNRSHTTAMQYVCRANGLEFNPAAQVKLLQLMVSKGADPKLCNAKGETALHAACYTGTTEAVQFLLDQGVDVNLESTSSGRTAIFFAIAAKRLELVTMLLEHHVDLSVTDNEGLTAIDLAQELNMDGAVRLLTEYQQNKDKNEATGSSGEGAKKSAAAERTSSSRTPSSEEPAVKSLAQEMQRFLEKRSSVYSDDSGSNELLSPREMRARARQQVVLESVVFRGNLHSRPQCGAMHALVLSRDSIYVFGGTSKPVDIPAVCADESACSESLIEEIWLYNLSKKTQRVVKMHPPPPPLIGATCVCTTSTQAFLIGGIGEDGVNTDVYNIDIDARKCLRAEASRFSSTSDVTTLSAPSHYFHTATVVQSVNTSSSTARLSSRLEYKIVVFGGPTNELHEFNTDTKQWTNIEATGDLPTARILHSATLVDDCIYFFGGYDMENEESSGTLHRFNLSTRTWELLAPQGALPSARFGHSSFVDTSNNILYMFGGVNEYANQEDAYALDLETLTWTWLSDLNFPSGLCSQRQHLVLFEGHAYLYSGRGDGAPSLISANIEALKRQKTSKRPRVPKRKKTIIVTPQSEDTLAPPSAELREKPDAVPEIGLLAKTSTKIARASRKMRSSSKSHDTEDLSAVMFGIDVASFIDLVLASIDNPTPEQIAEIKAKAADLRPKCGKFEKKSKKSKSRDKEKDAKRKEDGKNKESSTKERRITLLSSGAKKVKIEEIPYPRHHYDALELPTPWEPRVREYETKELKHRAAIVNELLETETSYVRDLGVLIGLYLKPFQNEFSGQVNDYDMNRLFKNVESLMAINVELLALLEAEEAKPQQEQRIGQVFLDMMPKLAKYNVYSANNAVAAETLTNLMQNNTFATLVRRVHQMDESKQQDLSGYIIKPFQRICRYPLLIKELFKHTPKDWPEHALLEKAMEEINRTVKGANEAKRVTDSLYEMVELQNSFVKPEGELKQLHRHTLTADEEFKRVVKGTKLTKCRCLLFEKMLVIAKPVGADKLDHTDIIPLEQLLVCEEPDTKVSVNNFRIVIPMSKAEKIVLSAATPEIKKQWMTLLLTIMKDDDGDEETNGDSAE